FYLVQEYIDGQNLEEELNHKGQFSEQEVLDMLQDILKILQFVHNKGIIHRDIKPSNIMRHHNGKLYLLDFGAVKQVANTPPGGVGSSTGIFSLGFAPPEQMSGGQVFPSTDLYALAVTAVMLLTGEKDVTKLFDVYSNQWKWQERVSVSPLVANTLNRMLLPAANQRFQSAQEVLDALNLTVQPVIPTQINPRQPTQIKSQPHSTPTQPAQQIPLSTLELLMGAGFSGFEGGLIAIALYGVLRSLNITFVAGAVILAILIFGQKQRWIERTEMLVLAAATWGMIFFFPVLRAGLSIKQVIILSVAAGLVAIAVTALFRLVYKLLTLFFSN
ncbi:serine/threonine protein kinase, partial [Fischerella thermalis CCMEE 5319]